MTQFEQKFFGGQNQTCLHVFPRQADHPLPGSPSFTQASKNILGTIYNFTRIIFCRITSKLYTTKTIYGLFFGDFEKIEHFPLRISAIEYGDGAVLTNLTVTTQVSTVDIASEENTVIRSETPLAYTTRRVKRRYNNI